MAEGDTIARLALQIESSIGGERLEVRAPDRRGAAAGVERLDGRVLSRAQSRGKNLLLHFDELVLHSHLGMSGGWHLYSRGESWRRPERTAWAVLRGAETEAVQFRGPTLRVLRGEALHRDPALRRLGPDILDEDLADEAAVDSLRRAEPGRELGDALLDQTLIAGIGNIFKSEGCFAARVDPWRRIDRLSVEELGTVVAASAALMRDSVHSGRRPAEVYRRAGRPCRVCDTPLRSAAQGDANRTTYWCPECQPPESE